MSKSKWIRLALLTSGATLAAAGCASSGYLPWVIGAGLLASVLGRGV